MVSVRKETGKSQIYSQTKKHFSKLTQNKKRSLGNNEDPPHVSFSTRGSYGCAVMHEAARRLLIYCRNRLYHVKRIYCKDA